MDELFEKHPNLERYYETSDGTKFYKEHHAQTHARTLSDRDVETVKRKDQAKSKTKPKRKGKKDLSPMAAAKLRVEAIEEMQSVSEVEAALKDETAKTVKEAGANRIATLKASDALESNEDQETITEK